MNQRQKARYFATSFCLLSLLFLGSLIVAIQFFSEGNKEVGFSSETDFNLTKTQRQKQRRIVDEMVKRQKKIERKLKSLKPVLDVDLSGMDFGLDGVGMDSVDLDSELLSENEDVVMDERTVDQRPRYLEKPTVEFPERALLDNVLKGIVKLRMLITKEGTVKDVNIISSTPKGYFEEVTISMVASWKFQPAKYRGRPVAMWAQQVVRFGE